MKRTTHTVNSDGREEPQAIAPRSDRTQVGLSPGRPGRRPSSRPLPAGHRSSGGAARAPPAPAAASSPGQPGTGRRTDGRAEGKATRTPPSPAPASSSSHPTGAATPGLAGPRAQEVASPRSSPRRYSPVRPGAPRGPLGHSPHFSEPPSAPLARPRQLRPGDPLLHGGGRRQTRRSVRGGGGGSRGRRRALSAAVSSPPDPRGADTSTKMAATPEPAWIQLRGRGSPGEPISARRPV